MADVKEQLAKIEELAKEDEEFRKAFFAAVDTKDAEKLVSLINSRGFDLTADDLELSVESRSLDEAELESVAGGKTRYEKIDEYCGKAGAFGCGAGLLVALWSPDYTAD